MLLFFFFGFIILLLVEVGNMVHFSRMADLQKD